MFGLSLLLWSAAFWVVGLVLSPFLLAYEGVEKGEGKEGNNERVDDDTSPEYYRPDSHSSPRHI